MKKLKIDKKTSKRFISYALIGTIALSTLVGCNNKSETRDSFLEDSVLENVSVITLDDGHKDLAKTVMLCDMTVCKGENHKIYNSVVTNEYFSDDDCSRDYYVKGVSLNKYNVINEESLIAYLTTEEIAKAANNKLTEDDVTNIINRIFVKEEKNSVQKVK